jgi:transmembrane sensor
MTRAHDINVKAAEWLVQLDIHGSPETWAALDAWLAANPRHRAAFLRLSVAWRRADALRSLRPLDSEVDEDLLSSARRRARERSAHGRRLRPRWAVALVSAMAVVIVAIGTVTWFALDRANTQDYSTTVGGLKRFALSDGSVVLLNTDSEVRVRFTASRRRVELRRGEALFTVAHDASRLFEVVADETTVRAVGTAFAVRLRDAGSLDVLVREGRVNINPPSELMVSAGHIATVRGHATYIRPVPDDEITRKLAWGDNRLSFRGDTLTEVIGEFNRYNRRRLVISDPSIAGLSIGGSYIATDPDSFVIALEREFHVHAHTYNRLFGPPIIRLEGEEP